MGAKRDDRDKDELLRGTLDMLILRTLAQDAMHGYGVAERIRQTSGDVLQIEEGSLYPALQRMEVRGWIASEWGRSANNRRARFYRLTAQGRRQLERELSSFDRVLEGIVRVLRPA